MPIDDRYVTESQYLVEEARAGEIKGINKCGAWDKVPIQECYERAGKPQILTRWVDVNKGGTIAIPTIGRVLWGASLTRKR